MGAGASVPEVADEYLDEEACKGLTGDKFDAAKWEAAAKNDDGKVSKADFLAAFKPAAKKRRLSLVGTADEGKDLGARRNSVLAVETEKAVDAADDDKKAGVLLETITTDLENPEGPEFASWALSCANQLSQKDQENQKILTEGGFPAQLKKYLTMYPDDIFTQYQGIQTMGNLAGWSVEGGKNAADEFGTDAMELVVKAIGDTDETSLLLISMRALRGLVNGSASNKAFETADLIVTLDGLCEEFKLINNFVYACGELKKELAPPTEETSAAEAPVPATEAA